MVSFTRWPLCNVEGCWTGERLHLTNTNVLICIFDHIHFMSFGVQNVFSSLTDSSINLLAVNCTFVTTLASSVLFLGVVGRTQGRKSLTVS